MANMETNHTPLSEKIMYRVHIARALRQLLSYGTLSFLVIVLSLWGVGREVWVARVLENMPAMSDLNALIRFYTYAFINTSMLVQALIVATLAGSFSFARYVEKTLSLTTLLTHQASLSRG